LLVRSGGAICCQVREVRTKKKKTPLFRRGSRNFSVGLGGGNFFFRGGAWPQLQGRKGAALLAGPTRGGREKGQTQTGPPGILGTGKGPAPGTKGGGRARKGSPCVYPIRGRKQKFFVRARGRGQAPAGGGRGVVGGGAFASGAKTGNASDRTRNLFACRSPKSNVRYIARYLSVPRPQGSGEPTGGGNLQGGSGGGGDFGNSVAALGPVENGVRQCFAERWLKGGVVGG